ncbi:MAG: aminoglycoside phosphotransferase family protein [Clostridia bacterium]|nr:aminoglycoside phosphotransferase family protein [Clostridia bacterium]
MILSITELKSLFETIIKEFRLEGNISKISCIGRGNINDTYLAQTVIENGIREYIVQRVNHFVFSEPQRIAENVCKVTEHIEKKLKKSGATDIRRRVVHYYRKPDGSFFHITENGDYWRVLSCIYNAHSVDHADIKHLRFAGTAFGEFQNLLSDFPSETLCTTIPDFHNTKKRYEDLRVAAKNDPFQRLSSVREELDYLLSMEKYATKLCEMQEKGILKSRVVHNDTKCNNVMFDDQTGENLAVVDLDTVMQGLVAYDFGDAVRFAANPGGEDNEDLSRVYLDLDYYKAFAEGFVPQIIGKVSDDEISSLPDGVLSITLELAARFLTDYLQGDVYFKCKKINHNLFRTRAQIALAKDVFGKMTEMRDLLAVIVESI